MSMMPSLDKTRITLRMPLSLRARLRKRVRDLKRDNPLATEQDVALLALERELANVKPDAEDAEWMKRERRRNAETRRRRQSGD